MLLSASKTLLFFTTLVQKADDRARRDLSFHMKTFKKLLPTKLNEENFSSRTVGIGLSTHLFGVFHALRLEE